MEATCSEYPDSDLLFLVQTAMPQRDDCERVVCLIRNDPDFVEALLGDRRVLQHLLSDDTSIVHVSPRLFFAALLLKARKDLETEAYTIERRQRQRVAIFDAPQAARLLGERTIRNYLADMLASFTRVRGFSQHRQVRKGVWQQQRFHDLDIDGLIRYSNAVSKERRFAIYKRAADACLFLASIFPEHVETHARFPFSHFRRTLEDYEREGRAFYGLAAGHQGRHDPQLTSALSTLSEHFALAEKPLTFMSERYLQLKKHTLFDL